MEISFCKFSETEKIFIQEVFNYAFEVKDFNRLFEVYEIFSKNFYADVDPNKMETIEKENLLLKTLDPNLKLKLGILSYQVGVDLPVLLKNETKTKGTIFIVAEDPLRSFEHCSVDIILSTPFGSHINKNKSNNLKVYWNVIKHLLDNHYDVYITDINKIWVKSKKNSKKESLIGEPKINFQKALQHEISFFKPTIIITYGKPALNAINLMGITTNAKIIQFPHPSGSANGAWAKILKDKYASDLQLCSDNNKIDYLKSAISQHLE